MDGVEETPSREISFRESSGKEMDAPTFGEHGVEWGTVIHQLLDLAMHKPNADLLPFAEAALSEHGLEKSRAQDAVKLVESVVNSDIWRRAKACRERLTEVPFEILLDETATTPTLIRGAIDLVFREPSGWVLVDYKTDRITPANRKKLIKKYAPQINLYCRAWKRCTGEDIVEAGLFFSATQEFVTTLTPPKNETA